MAALDLIGPAWDTVRTAKRRKETEARERIDREMAALRDEFAGLVYRAYRIDEPHATVSAIARTMQCSRTLVYDFLKRGDELADHEPLFADPMAQIVLFNKDTDTFSALRPGDSKAYRLDAGGKSPEYEYGADGAPTPESMPDDEWWAWWATVSADVTAYVKAHRANA